MNDEKRKIPNWVLKDNPNASVKKWDFHGFTEYECFKIWPSQDKNDRPDSLFVCHRCEESFYIQIAGIIRFAWQKDDYDPLNPWKAIYDDVEQRIQKHKVVCQIASPMLDELDIFDRIKKECVAQAVKFDEQGHHPLYWYAILGEEVGEVGKVLVENDLESYEAELIQVAAICVSMIQSLHNPKLKWCEPKSLTHSTKRIKK